MVTKSQSNTPNPDTQDHPAHQLEYGSDEQINGLMKLHPIQMPNMTLDIEESLNRLRSSYRYVYVMNWLAQCRGFVKLQSEYFDVDLFEIELLNMVSPPPVDESILFVNKLKLALISTLQGAKCTSVNNFEHIFRLWFGIETPLKGRETVEEGDENDQEQTQDQEQNQEQNHSNEFSSEESEPKFDFLLIEDKIEILYILMSYITQYQQFRAFLDKTNASPDVIRSVLLYSDAGDQPGIGEDYVLLFDNTRLYKRIVEYSELSIPKIRKEAPAEPEEFYAPEQFDVKSVTFEVITRNIYEMNTYLLEIYNQKKSNKYKELYSKLATDEVVDSIYSSEIKKRKVLTNRRKEVQLANLLATRKRSSRLEAKEKQRFEEERLQRIRDAEELKLAAERRSERRRLLRKHEPTSTNNYNTSNLSREERLKLRKITTEISQPYMSQSPEYSNRASAEPEVASEPTPGSDVGLQRAPGFFAEGSTEPISNAVKKEEEPSPSTHSHLNNVQESLPHSGNGNYNTPDVNNAGSTHEITSFNTTKENVDSTTNPDKQPSEINESLVTSQAKPPPPPPPSSTQTLNST